MINKASSSAAMGLRCLAAAREYFEDVVRSTVQNTKQRHQGYVGRINYIINDAKSEMNEEGKKILEEEINKGDALYYEAVIDKLRRVPVDQKIIVENILDLILSGERVDAELK